jgi:hypothetical protein
MTAVLQTGVAAAESESPGRVAQHCGKEAAMFEQLFILVSVGVAVGLSARAVCRSSADGEGFLWVWPAVSVTVLGVIVLGPRGFASSVAAVACLIGLPLAVAEVCRRVRGLIDQPSADSDSSFIGTQIDVCTNGCVSGKALAAGLLEIPAASALPLTRNCEISASINLSPNNRVGNAPRGPVGTRLNEVDCGPCPRDALEPCAEDLDDGSDPELVALADESVTQWLQRSRPAPGEERIDGMTRVEFAPGEKQIAVHVAFCPPLPTVPVVTCELLDDADVRLRVTTVQTYGVRIEAKRSGDVGEALAIAVRFSALVEAASAPRQSSRSAA